MIGTHHGSACFRDRAVMGVKLFRHFYEIATRRSLLKSYGNETVGIVQIPGYKSTFAGYYDVSPFRPSGGQIVVHATNWPLDRVPTSSATVDIYIYDLESGEANYLDSTHCWNWQQGARVQWINRDTIAFNKLINSEIRAVLLDVEDGTREILPENISIAFKDEYLLSLDYNVLSEFSEYGYAVTNHRLYPETVTRYDFARKSTTPLFDWHELSFLNQPGAVRGHVNHLWPSPTGNSFVFVYRYWVGSRRYDSVVLFDHTTKLNKVLVANTTLGHYTWRNDHELLVWGIFEDQEGYFVLDTVKSSLRRISCLTDGHPNFLHDNAFVADIAPSFRKMPTRTLYVLDFASQQKTDLITLSHPTIFNDACRCDMHVSLSPDRALFQVDSRHLYGRRAVVVGSIPQTLRVTPTGGALP